MTPTTKPHAKAPAKIRVLCVDDSEDIAQMLGQCIAAEPDMENAGCLHTADHLVADVGRRRPDVVLLDMSMPGKDPLAVLRELTAAFPPHCGVSDGAGGDGRGGGGGAARVIVFSGRTDRKAVDSAAEAGACGYLSKDAEIPVMLEAIREVARGHVAFGVWL